MRKDSILQNYYYSKLPTYQTKGQVKTPYVYPSMTMPRNATSSTAITYNTAQGPISTATTGQKKEDVAASNQDLAKYRIKLKNDEIKRVNERKAAKAMNERKTDSFTFPNGQTKTYDQMNWAERQYVAGKSIEGKGKINEDEEAWYDNINPLNWITSAAGALGEAPYEARQSGSNMPYLSAIATPVVQGMFGFNPLGSAMKVPGKLATSMESGLLSKLKPSLSSTLNMSEEEMAQAMKEIEQANLNPKDLELNLNPNQQQINERTDLKNLFNKLDDPNASAITPDEYRALLEKQKLEREAGDLIRNQGKPDPLNKINLSNIINREGLVTPGYKSSIQAGPFWEQNKNHILNYLADENTANANAARQTFINDAKSFKRNVTNVNDINQSPSAVYKDIHQLIKEKNIRDALFPTKVDASGNPIADAILKFFKNDMTLTGDEAGDLLHGYNPSNPFTNWSNKRINNTVDLLHRQRLASGLMNINQAGEHLGIGKVPPLKYFTYGEKDPLGTLGKEAMQGLKTGDKQLIENGPNWFDETIAKGNWKDVGMEMRSSMKKMGLDPTNEQDVLKFKDLFKIEQRNFKLNQYSGKPDIETLFGGINKNKFGGSTYAKGGNVSVGQQMTVSTEQLEELKRQGYKIQML